MKTTLILNITTPEENNVVVIDAINETLRTLAADGVIDDSNDDAWEWVKHV